MDGRMFDGVMAQIFWSGFAAAVLLMLVAVLVWRLWHWFGPTVTVTWGG